MQKTTLLLAVALAFSASSWGQDVKINGTGVSLEANKTPIHTAKNPQAIALLPQDLHLAVPGKFTVAVAALNSPPLTVFADDNKTLLGSEADIARLVAESLGLEVNVVPTSWEDWPLGVISGKYDAAISNITVTKERKEKFDFATYRKDSLGFYVKSTSPLSFFSVTAMCAAFGQPPSTLPTSLVLPVSAAFHAPITLGPKKASARPVCRASVWAASSLV